MWDEEEEEEEDKVKTRIKLCFSDLASASPFTPTQVWGNGFALGWRKQMSTECPAAVESLCVFHRSHNSVVVVATPVSDQTQQRAILLLPFCDTAL